MAGLYALLGLSRDAVAAQAYGLEVTGQNITNVNTPGYVRRDAILATRAVGTQTYGGVDVVGLRRAFDQFVAGRYLEASGQSSAASQRESALSSVEAVFNDASGGGIGASIQALFSSFSALAANPSDPSARSQVLERATDLAQRFRDGSLALTTLRRDLLSQAEGVAAEVNDRLAQVAKLNGQIAQAEAEGNDAADLKDQRGNLLEELSTRIDIQSFTDGTGRLVVRGAGATLVEGTQAGALSISLQTSGAMRVDVRASGGASVDVTAQLAGGSLAGLRDVRDGDIVTMSQGLDQLAFDIGQAVNNQHALGYALDGTTGRRLFSVAASASGTAASIALDTAMVGHPELLGAASSAASLPQGSNNAVALGKLGAARIAGSGQRTASESYSDLVGAIGLKMAGAKQNDEMRDAIKAQTKAMRDSVSGVSLDEEMVNLSRYQRAFQAGSKLIKTVDELLAGFMQEVL